MAHGDPGPTIGKINLAGTSDDPWANVPELQVADGPNFIGNVAARTTSSVRDESERVALNIIRRIDEMSESWGHADDINALANALAVLSDIAKYR